MSNPALACFRPLGPSSMLLAVLAGAAVIYAMLRVGALPPSGEPAASTRTPAEYGHLPLLFEENRGQSAAEVRFIARGPRYTQFVTAEEIVWRLQGERHEAAVRMRLVGANPAPLVTGESPLPGRSQYFKGGDRSQWISGARHFSAVTLDGVYPGVDLKLYGNQAQAEYDFIVQPGADPAPIRIRFAGADSVTIGEQGEIVLSTPAGELIHRAPVAYQPGIDGKASSPVSARFVRDGASEVRFELGQYDPARPLIIDPVYEYSTYLGGTAGEGLSGFAPPTPYQTIIVDGSGQAYVAGITDSTDFPHTAGVLQPSSGGDTDFFIARLSAAGDAILYATYLGGSGDELGIGGLAVNGSGEIYFAGLSQSPDFPTTAGAYDTTPNGNPGSIQDVVVVKLNAAGDALAYSTYLGSNMAENVAGFAVDSGGNAYVAGHTPGSATQPFPVTAGAFQAAGDQFVTKLNPAGAGLIYSTRFGNAIGGGIRIRAMALDGTGHVYVTGTVSTNDLPLLNPYDNTSGVGIDAFVTKFNPTGTGLVYSTYLGGVATDEGFAIAVDSAGGAYVAGSTSGVVNTNDFPTTAGAFRTTPLAATAGFVTKLAPAGNALTWSTYFGRPTPSGNNAIALDSGNRVYVAVEGGLNALKADEPPESCIATVSAPTLARLSADGGTLDYGLDIGGSTVFSGGSDVSFNPIGDIAVDSGNSVYVIGATNAADFPTYQGFQAERAGLATDAYIAKLSDAASSPMPTLQFSSAAFSVSETNGNATITVNRTGRAAGVLRVRAATSNGTATAGADYTATDVVLEWRNGDLAPKTFSVPVASDGIADGGETVNLTLTKNWCLGDLGSPATAVLTIDEGSAPSPGTLQLSAGTYSVTEGGSNASITVTRANGSAGAVSARLVTSNGTASAGSDYTAVDTVVSFADGDSAAKIVLVPILQDTTDEPDETVNLALSAPTGGASLGAQTTAALTITDDDNPPPVVTPPATPPGGGGGGGGGGSLNLVLLLGLAVLWLMRQRDIFLGARMS